MRRLAETPWQQRAHTHTHTLQCSARQPDPRRLPALECVFFPVRRKVLKQMLLQEKNEDNLAGQATALLSPHSPRKEKDAGCRIIVRNGLLVTSRCLAQEVSARS